MAKINRGYMLKLSEMDDEDAFDPWELSPEELFTLDTDAHQKFIDEYKAYYDDIKTSSKLHKEDW